MARKAKYDPKARREVYVTIAEELTAFGTTRSYPIEIDIDGMTPQSAIETLQQLIDRYQGQYTNIKIDVERGDYNEGERDHIRLIGTRMETDKELADRLAREKAAEDAQTARDLAVFEALRKKLGK